MAFPTSWSPSQMERLLFGLLPHLLLARFVLLSRIGFSCISGTLSHHVSHQLTCRPLPLSSRSHLALLLQRRRVCLIIKCFLLSMKPPPTTDGLLRNKVAPFLWCVSWWTKAINTANPSALKPHSHPWQQRSPSIYQRRLHCLCQRLIYCSSSHLSCHQVGWLLKHLFELN